MGFAYKISSAHIFHFLTFAVVDWIDIFSRPIYADIVIESLRYCQESKGLRIHAWCLMTNHIHLIVSVDNEFGIANPEQPTNPEQHTKVQNLSDIFRDMKKYTSKRIRECMNSLAVNESRREWMNERFEMAGGFWQEGIHPIVLESLSFTQQKLDYIHRNPVVAGYVWEPWEYRYSSARDYMTDQNGLLKIEKLEL